MDRDLAPPASADATAASYSGTDHQGAFKLEGLVEGGWAKTARRIRASAARGARFPGALVLFEAVFYFAYKYGMSFSHAIASPFWFPDSVLLCALLLSPAGRWWIFILAPLPIRLLVGVPPDIPLWFLLTTFALDSANGLLAAAVLRHFIKNPVRLATVKEFVLFCAFAAFLIPAVSAFGGAAVRHALGQDYWTAWQQWFLGDTLTHLVITPALLYWGCGTPHLLLPRSAKSWLEGVLLAAGLSLTAHLAFTATIDFTDALFFAPVPFLFWAAIRFGMFGASGAMVLLAGFAVGAALGGRGPFAEQSPSDTALVLQNFLLLRAAPLYLVATLIEQMHAVEHNLRESELRFRTMANTVPVMIWKAGVDRRLTFLNQVWLDFTGITLQEQLGDSWTARVHPDERQRCGDIFENSFNRRAPFTVECRLRRHDEEYYWVLCTGIPRFSHEGNFLGYICSCVDISARKEAERAQRQAFEEIARLQEQLQAENIYLREELEPEITFERVTGQSPHLKYVLYKVEQVAPTDATVLILGETGTGKELLARAIHERSGRKDRPLIKVDCATLPANLIESELFGHEKGAFTGASQKQIGRFELAHNGTIFLDEIGELPLALQPKLLRFLEEGEFERLGSSRALKVDVRVLAATNRNLKEEVRQGRFREDLYYRIDVYAITLPPLRERPQDIPLLVQVFVNEFCSKLGKKIDNVPQRTLHALQRYPWPGNVRELRNVIERAVIISSSATLHVELPQAVDFERPNGSKLEEVERSHILKTLEKTRWRIAGDHGAAALLGMHPSTLRSRMEKLGIGKPEI